MLKRCAIFLLLIAYTIVFAHSIVPHHHHDDAHHPTVLAASNHANHDDDHDDDDNAGLEHDFAAYVHSGNSTVVYRQPQGNTSISTISTAYLIAVFNFNIRAFESPPPLVQHSNDYIPITQHCLCSKGLRAPPCALV